MLIPDKRRDEVDGDGNPVEDENLVARGLVS
jgi:hypothetical protein